MSNYVFMLTYSILLLSCGYGLRGEIEKRRRINRQRHEILNGRIISTHYSRTHSLN